MKTIKLTNVEIKLDVEDELKVRELRKIQPIIAKHGDGEEIDMVIKIICALSPQEDIEETIDGLNMDDFTKLSKKVTDIIDTKKKISK